VRDANPIIYLIPGVGMLSFAKDKATARIAGEFYVNAINVMRGANGVDTYVGLPEQEAFDIEYWLLEEAKLQRMPKPKSLAGRIALVTGGAGGIGQAVARQLLQEGACVMLTDIDAEALEQAHRQDLAKVGGKDSVGTVQANITSEERGGGDPGRGRAALRRHRPAGLERRHRLGRAAGRNHAGIWKRNQDILVTGYFLVSRAAFRIMKQQSWAAAWSSSAARTAWWHRPAHRPTAPPRRPNCTWRAASRWKAPHGIRVNVVNPDAVIRGSRIWDGKWKEERAAVEQDRGRRRRRVLPQAQHAETERPAGRYRRSRVLPSPATRRARAPAIS
jgi:NAD(P)-dependent dehydrogenase (short-subunit alcohol dehydrogenase family)